MTAIQKAEKRMTELVSLFINSGFVFNAYTMSGIAGGEFARIDLVRKQTFIRICIEYRTRSAFAVVARKKRVKALELARTIWSNDLTVISEEEFRGD